MRSEWRHGPMNHCPETTNPPRQEGRILVVSWHNDTKSFKAPKILSDANFLSSGMEVMRGSSIPPHLLRVLLRIGHGRRLTVNLPTINPVHRPSCAQVREPASIFYSTKK